MVEKQYGAPGKAGDPAVSNGETATPQREGWPRSYGLQEAILNSSRQCVMIADTNGIVQSFNRGAERLLGYARADVINKLNSVDLLDPLELDVRARTVSLELSIAIAPGFEALTCKTLRDGEDCFESTLIAQNRQRIQVSIWAARLRDELHRIIGYVFFMTDIPVQQFAFEAYGGAASVEPAGFSQPDLLARMSHEIRTPLNAILGFAQLMESGTPAPTASQKRGINLILQAGWHMEKLITMIRDLALIESGVSSLSLAPVSLASVMHECQAMIESQARRRGVRVMFSPLEHPCLVSADRTRLQQVLGNLVSAAIEYSEVDGAVVVNCDTRGADRMHIAINGGNESSAEPFPQARPAFDDAAQEAAAVEGLGIGLLLARRLVVLMGGTVGADSNVGAGKLFSFDLIRLRMPLPADLGFNSSDTVVTPGVTRKPT